MGVQEIKEAVQHLSLEERAEVAACLHSWSDDSWDEKMKRDLASGKLDEIPAQVDADIAKTNLIATKRKTRLQDFRVRGNPA